MLTRFVWPWPQTFGPIFCCSYHPKNFEHWMFVNRANDLTYGTVLLLGRTHFFPGSALIRSCNVLCVREFGAWSPTEPTWTLERGDIGPAPGQLVTLRRWEEFTPLSTNSQPARSHRLKMGRLHHLLQGILHVLSELRSEKDQRTNTNSAKRTGPFYCTYTTRLPSHKSHTFPPMFLKPLKWVSSLYKRYNVSGGANQDGPVHTKMVHMSNHPT